MAIIIDFIGQKNEMIIKNKTLYELVMSRANKRRLAFIVKNNITDYRIIK